MRPRLARNKKAREPAVSIFAAEQSLAIGVIRIDWLRLPPARQGTVPLARAATPAS